eukprot:2387008-Prymnesium_polylepis.1
MIEEWMLLANMTVAGAIAEAFPASALLRRHPPPLDAAFASAAAQRTRTRAPCGDVRRPINRP